MAIIPQNHIESQETESAISRFQKNYRIGELLYTTSLNCLCDANEAYLAMKTIYEHYSGKIYDAPMMKSGKNSVKETLNKSAKRLPIYSKI